ncbi:hypothetical protein DVB69_15710 [Sporosarcina sp. BI001-red]|uniref:hypothetical protein n=1 Tax=Sporosarcina sp. BI001-red TaxID=2282866 RepID=UPI000E23F129|nr:hypothetical protein [Sporosarcina sp. BI001-red]REB05205.1 hypothetical protein DVB69_15710 [Sporosarcina sp. BI001-red]
MTIRNLWIAVIIFSVLELVAIPVLLVVPDKLYQTIDGIIIIAFIIYPLFFLLSLLMLKKGIKKMGAVILLIPLLIYTPILMVLQELIR